MRRPRAGDERSSRSRAAPGLRPGAIRPPARSSLTAGREACPRFDGAAAQKGLRPKAEGGRTEGQKARPGAVTTLRWRAERRHTFARRCDQDCMTRPSARHPLDIFSGVDSPERPVRGRRKWTTAYPAPPRIRAAQRWLYPPHPEEGAQRPSRRMKAATGPHGSRRTLRVLLTMRRTLRRLSFPTAAPMRYRRLRGSRAA